jgi:hypothetical protein
MSLHVAPFLSSIKIGYTIIHALRKDKYACILKL